MNLNTIAMIQNLKSQIDLFKANHPKFPLFLNAVSQNAAKEGTIIEITVTSPEGKSYTSNLKLNHQDMELLESLKKMKQ